jgi:UDP-N-acetylglucosamine:LPS N-acetylglucosamine transferase
MKKLDFLYFDAGGGHRSAANALRQVIAEQQRSWEIRLVNLQELLEPLDVFRKISGLRLQDVYNLMLKKGWTLGSPQLTAGMHMVLAMYRPAQIRLLEKFWLESRPNMVVSLVPNFNLVLTRSLRQALPGVPLVTVITDIADYPPHFWIDREEQYIVCGSDRAVEQARQHGHSDERILRTSGMILNPRFYTLPEVDRAAERKRHGLHPDLPTGIILFGGEGNMVMLEIVERLESCERPLQLIAICGHNEKLQERLRTAKPRIPLLVEGFTKEVPYYMQLADFFIGKPGPGSISEALKMKLPVIVECNAWTLPQERYNAEWITGLGAGIVLKNFRGIAEAVNQLLEPAAYERYRANAAAQDNRAVFEIPDILHRILEQSAGVSKPALPGVG